MKPILTTTKSLSIIPQLDLKHNLKKLAEWKIKTVFYKCPHVSISHDDVMKVNKLIEGRER